jgi:hypothetical protein
MHPTALRVFRIVELKDNLVKAEVVLHPLGDLIVGHTNHLKVSRLAFRMLAG